MLKTFMSYSSNILDGHLYVGFETSGRGIGYLRQNQSQTTTKGRNSDLTNGKNRDLQR